MGKIGLIGIIIGFVGFTTYYCYAYFNYPNIPAEVGALNYLPLMFSLSFLSVMLYLKMDSGTEKSVYGFNAVLWMSISLSYLFKDVLHVITSKLFIILVFSLCLLIGLLVYCFKRH